MLLSTRKLFSSFNLKIKDGLFFVHVDDKQQRGKQLLKRKALRNREKINIIVIYHCRISHEASIKPSDSFFLSDYFRCIQKSFVSRNQHSHSFFILYFCYCFCVIIISYLTLQSSKDRENWISESLSDVVADKIAVHRIVVEQINRTNCCKYILRQMTSPALGSRNKHCLMR